MFKDELKFVKYDMSAIWEKGPRDEHLIGRVALLFFRIILTAMFLPAFAIGFIRKF